MLPRTLFVLLLVIAPVGHAAVIEVDLNAPGDGLVTRDTDQSLDFLDLTVSQGLSLSEVFNSLVPGQFPDFRWATEVEVISMINNFGFSPNVQDGQFVTGNTGSDQLSTLVGMVGVTGIFVSHQYAWGVTSGNPSGIPGSNGRRSIALRDFLDPSTNDEVNASLTSRIDANPPDRAYWLVRSVSVAEPGTFSLLMLSLFGLSVYNRTRRRGHLWGFIRRVQSPG